MPQTLAVVKQFFRSSVTTLPTGVDEAEVTGVAPGLWQTSGEIEGEID
jgi:hypothetical protein